MAVCPLRDENRESVSGECAVQRAAANAAELLGAHAGVGAVTAEALAGAAPRGSTGFTASPTPRPWRGDRATTQLIVTPPTGASHVIARFQMPFAVYVPGWIQTVPPVGVLLMPVTKLR